MSDEKPQHDEIVEILRPPRPAYFDRRQWCGYCQSWKWEDAQGSFRHLKNRGSRCKFDRNMALLRAAAKEAQPPTRTAG